MSIKFLAKKSLIWTSINQFGIQIINFIVLLVLTRLLSPKEIGLIALISILVGVGNILINSGLSQSLLRTPNPTEEDYSAVFYFNLIIGVIFYALVYILAPYISLFYKSQILTLIIRIYCLTFLINSITNIQIAKLTIDLNFKIQAYITLPGAILSGLLGIFLAIKNFGVWSLVWPQIFLSFYTATVYFLYTKWVPKFKFRLNSIIPHWKFSYKLMLAGLLDTIYVNLYSPIVGKKFGLYQAGFYYRADSIKQFPLSNLATILNRVIYPLLTPYQHNEILKKSLFSKILKMTVF
jgi:O-antigen/teichoic acid export membrane protein